MDDRYERAPAYLYCIHILAWRASEGAAEASEDFIGGLAAFPDLEMLTEISVDTDGHPTPTPAEIRAVAQDLLDLAEADELDSDTPPPADHALLAAGNRMLHEKNEALQARITELEAELLKPVAGPWRDTAHGRWRLDMGGSWALKWNTDGWSVWTENHTCMAHGPETGPEAEALVDAAAAPFWRLTPTPESTP